MKMFNKRNKGTYGRKDRP